MDQTLEPTSERTAGAPAEVRVQFSSDGALYCLPGERPGIWLSVESLPMPFPAPLFRSPGWSPVAVDGGRRWRRVHYATKGLLAVAHGRAEMRAASDRLVVDFRSFCATYDAANTVAGSNDRFESDDFDLVGAAERAARALEGLSPERVAAALLRAAAARPVPDARRADAIQVISHFCGQFASRLRALDYTGLHQDAALFEKRFMQACAPIAPAEVLAPHRQRLSSLGWSTVEIEFLLPLLGGGAAIRGYSARDITIGDRLLSREEVRESARPAQWTERETWHAQFPRVEE